MTSLLTERSRRGRRRVAHEALVHEGRGAAGGRSTLEEVVSGAWEDLTARALTVCPVCGDDMHGTPGGRFPAACHGCGSELL